MENAGKKRYTVRFQILQQEKTGFQNTDFTNYNPPRTELRYIILHINYFLFVPQSNMAIVLKYLIKTFIYLCL